MGRPTLIVLDIPIGDGGITVTAPCRRGRGSLNAHIEVGVKASDLVIRGAVGLG
jgi:hypothetical protein